MVNSPSSSAQEQVTGFQRAIDAALEDVATESLPKQKKTFECCAGCFDKGMQYDKVGRCVRDCQTSGEQFSDSLQREVQSLQSSISACQDRCLTKHTVAHSSASDASKRQEIEQEMETCTAQCYAQHLTEIPGLVSRLKTQLK